jgi:4-amino-4-deoxy-L-arabinose transferase-like glycosyltransferase
VVILPVLAYLALTVPHLGVFPPVGEDEPWIAAAPYKLATQNVLGSDLFAGYFGMERHHYAHMPIYPLAQAAVFKAFGAGVVQMRALPVACGLLLLVLVFVVGRQAGGDRVGAAAVALMVTLRIGAGGAGTGILLLDRARINRYDIAVPVFGLAAFWAFNRAEDARRASWYALTGAFTALASLSHLYGVFWLPVFVALTIARHGRAFLT